MYLSSKNKINDDKYYIVLVLKKYSNIKKHRQIRFVKFLRMNEKH